MRLFSEFERIVVRGMHVHTRSRRLHVAAHHVQVVADHGAGLSGRAGDRAGAASAWGASRPCARARPEGGAAGSTSLPKSRDRPRFRAWSRGWRRGRVRQTLPGTGFCSGFHRPANGRARTCSREGPAGLRCRDSRRRPVRDDESRVLRQRRAWSRFSVSVDVPAPTRTRLPRRRDHGLAQLLPSRAGRALGAARSPSRRRPSPLHEPGVCAAGDSRAHPARASGRTRRRRRQSPPLPSPLRPRPLGACPVPGTGHARIVTFRPLDELPQPHAAVAVTGEMAIELPLVRR